MKMKEFVSKFNNIEIKYTVVVFTINLNISHLLGFILYIPNMSAPLLIEVKCVWKNILTSMGSCPLRLPSLS